MQQISLYWFCVLQLHCIQQITFKNISYSLLNLLGILSIIKSVITRHYVPSDVMQMKNLFLCISHSVMSDFLWPHGL